MTDANVRANATLELERGDASLRAAEALLAVSLWDDAVSRAYYAAFHWLRAALSLRGLEARTHAGTHDLFFRHFVAPGDAPRELARRFSVLQSDAREQIDSAVVIRDWVRGVLAGTGWGPASSAVTTPGGGRRRRGASRRPTPSRARRGPRPRGPVARTSRGGHLCDR